MNSSKWGALLAIVMVASALAASCSNSHGNGFNGEDAGSAVDGAAPMNTDATVGGSNDDSPSLGPLDGSGGDAQGALSILPPDITLPITVGQPVPTQTYTAMVGGAPVGAQWTIDRGEIGAIGVASGVLTPTASLGGKATITATYNGRTATTTVSVKLLVVQAGDPTPPLGGGGIGGYGGVGGTGEGDAATNTQITTMNGTPTQDPAMSLLYPYDKTVWPKGILAPLLQWEPGNHAFTALYIHASGAHYDYKGYFQKPAAAASFVNHPVPQSIWKQLTNSSAGDTVTLSIVLTDGTQAYGPLTESWSVANGELKGTVYYESYGTSLSQNQCCVFGSSTQKFGGATLAIHAGSPDPVLIAGVSNGQTSGCRVCHSVSANGATLVTQQGDSSNNYSVASKYALTGGNSETTIPGNTNFRFSAIYPDGTFLLSNSQYAGTSSLYDLRSGALGQQLAWSGAPVPFMALTPSFSPDGAHIAYDDQNSNKLTAMDFSNANKFFSNPRVVFSPPSGHAYWPSFLPTNSGVVFELETRENLNSDHVAGTRSDCEDSSGTNTCHDEGSHGELWWVDLQSGASHRLDAANGSGYLPPHPTYHGNAGDDATLNYQPTVNPVPSGGYAWVVFTTRRRYGNVATINPFHSDPRYRDLSTVANATPKKLWVAAVDLNAAPGSDPSHPAFYLPGQELLAGNSRGFWVVDPCKQDGSSCETGDECCGGFCRPGGDGGALVCTAQQPSCAQEFEKCTATSDCCGAAFGIQCVNQRCAQKGPQ